MIEQPGNPDQNYIVLMDDQGRSLLNGEQPIIAYHNVSYYAGVAYEYNGSNSTVERVNTTYTKKLKRDLRVEVSLPFFDYMIKIKKNYSVYRSFHCILLTIGMSIRYC